MRAYVDWKLKTTSGKYKSHLAQSHVRSFKQEWLLWKRKLDRLIEQANAGQSVDPMDIDQLARKRPDRQGF
jgi:hypothetical protein